MRYIFLYVFRFLTYNRKKTFSVLLSFVLASIVVSVCFFTVDSIDRTILTDAESVSGGYNLFLVDTKSSTDKFISENSNVIIQEDKVEIIGYLSPNLFAISDSDFLHDLVEKDVISITGHLPESNEILINQIDLEYLGFPTIGSSVDVKLIHEEDTVIKSFKVSGIYSGNNYVFVDDLPLAWVGQDTVEPDVSSTRKILTYIKTVSGTSGRDLCRMLESEALDRIKENSDFDFYQYTTYNSILSGTSGVSVYFIFFIAVISAAIMMISTQIIMMRDELASFSIIQDLGSGYKTFFLISIVKNMIIGVISLPFSVFLSLGIVFLLTYTSNIEFCFYVSVRSVVISVLLPIILFFLITFISVYIVKRNNGVSLDRFRRNVIQLRENRSFWFRYSYKRIGNELKDNIILCIATVLCVCSLSSFIYTGMICGMNIDMIDSRLNSENAFITVYANGKSVGISEEDVNDVRNFSDIIDLTPETSYYSEFVMDYEKTEYEMQKLDDKDISKLLKSNRNSEYIRANLIYTENLKAFLSDYSSIVVEGSVEKIFSDDEYNYVAVVDNLWTKNSQNCYHVGDQIIIQNCKFDSLNSTYSPVENNITVLTVCAVIKTERGDIYEGFSSFPLFIGFETYKEITEYDRYKKLNVYVDSEDNKSVERNLKHIFNTSKYGEGQLIISNTFAEYNEDRLFTQRIEKFINFIFIILSFLAFLGLFFIGNSKIRSEENEIVILKNIGVSDNSILKLSVFESILFTLTEFLIASLLNSFVLKTIFDMFKSSNVFPADYLWNYPKNIIFFSLLFCLIINFASVVFSTVLLLKEKEVNKDVENF